MHNAALAVLNYESSRKALPNGVTYSTALIPTGQLYAWGANGGKPIMGANWIIDVLPYMEEQALHDQFDPNTFKPPYNIISVSDPTVNGRNYIARVQSFRHCFVPVIHITERYLRISVATGRAAITRLASGEVF